MLELDCQRSQNNSFRDYRNPMLTPGSSEMTLRQFGTVSEFLSKLKADLRLSYPRYVIFLIANHLVLNFKSLENNLIKF